MSRAGSISRRDFFKLTGLSCLASSIPTLGRALPAPDYSIEIAPLTLELSPRLRLRTTAYNGQVPGALLRFKESKPVTIEVTNRTDRPEVIHWHGLFTPPEADGAIEEGTPPIGVGATVRYSLTPRPAGFRWYHTHTMAMNDLSLAQYSGQHGFLMIEPREDPARYDQEFFLALHDWAGYMLANDDGAMNVGYAAATINGKILGSGEPLRVKQGQRVLLHILNSSPTEVHWITLAGHTLKVVALDGNAVPAPRAVSMLRLAPAERVSALVEMNNPGVWVLGEVRKHVQSLGMAAVVEYENRSGTARWEQPPELLWSYEQFAAHPDALPSEPPILVPLVIESKFRGHGAMEAWTINGSSYPQAKVAPLIRGRRYRLQFINKSRDDHPLHLHRHSFELRTLGTPAPAAAAAAAGTGTGTGTGASGGTVARELRGLIKDVVLVDAETTAEVEFTADNPGATLFHCHQQNHMDLGFMMLLEYA